MSEFNREEILAQEVANQSFGRAWPRRSGKALVRFARRGADDAKRFGGDVYSLLESAFGIVPSWLKRPEDAVALLAYAPPQGRRERA